MQLHYLLAVVVVNDVSDVIVMSSTVVVIIAITWAITRVVNNYNIRTKPSFLNWIESNTFQNESEFFFKKRTEIKKSIPHIPSGNTLDLINVYSMLGPVNAWVGDRLWMGKPPRHRTRHTGLLAWSCHRWAGWNKYLAKAGSKQAYCVILPVPMVLQCGANAWLKGLVSGDQHQPTWSGSTLEVCYM